MAADQLVKLAAVKYLSPDHALEVVPGFFNLVLVYNKGAAFGIFHGWVIALAVFSLLACGVLGLFMRRAVSLGKTGCAVVFALLLGGILGNMVDRIRLGGVIDFLQFYAGRYYWPAFNLADSIICVCVGIMVVDMFRADNSSFADCFTLFDSKDKA